MGTLKGFASPFGPHLPPPPRSLPPSWTSGPCTFPTTPARCARALALGLARWCTASGGASEASGVGCPSRSPIGGEAGGLPTRLDLEPKADKGFSFRGVPRDGAARGTAEFATTTSASGQKSGHVSVDETPGRQGATRAHTRRM